MALGPATERLLHGRIKLTHQQLSHGTIPNDITLAPVLQREVQLGLRPWVEVGWTASIQLERASAATHLNLISFLKVIPGARMRRGVRIPSWYLLLVAVLGILSQCQSLRDLERFARRHHAVLTEALRIELKRPPSDSAFRYFFLHVDVTAVCGAIRDWTIAQIPGGTADLDQLVRDGKTLRGSIEPTDSGGSAFIAQVTLYSAALAVAIAQVCYVTGQDHKRSVLKKLLGELDLEGVLIQAVGEAFSEGVALHTQQPFFDRSRSRGPTSSCRS